MDSSVNFKLELIKNSLGTQLVDANHLQTPQGVPTGVDLLDQFFLWRGLPLGDLSLFTGRPGGGATQLWLQTALRLQKQNKWAAWIDGRWNLCPLGMTARQLDLKKLLVVRNEKNKADFFWLLQEMIASRLFTLIGCPQDELEMQNHQLIKLKKLARQYQVALVFFQLDARKSSLNPNLWSCVIDFQRDFLTVQRAQHRMTPFVLPGSVLHENFMPQFPTSHRTLVC